MAHQHEYQSSPSFLQRVFRFASEKKSIYIVSIVFALISVACAVAPYLIIAKMVAQLLDGERDWQIYCVESGIVALFWLGNVLFHAVSTALSHGATFHILGSIRKKICDHLFEVPLGSVLNIPSGSLKNILVERIDSMETTLAHIVPEFTSNLILPLGLFVYLFVIDWRMGLASLGTLPIGIIAAMIMMRDAREKFSDAIQKTKILNDTAVEYIHGIEVIKAFSKSKSSYEKFVAAARDGSECYVDWMRSTIWPFCIAFVVAPATMLSILPVGGYLFYTGSLDGIDFITVIIISLSLLQPIMTAYSYQDDIAKAYVIFGEIGEVMDMKSLDRPENDLDVPAHNGIELQGVHFGYHDKDKAPKEIIHGIDMSLPDGSYTAFVGPSGSGKSTIARLIASLWDVDSGSVSIGGVNIKNLSLETYHRRVAYVSQDNYLFNLSVRENIRLGRPDATDAQVEACARNSGCYEFIMSLENGFDTIVGGCGARLSGGERQRIAIARAMMKNAPIVILDEATAYTDPENEAIVQRSIAKLVAGKTLIVIAHRLSTVCDADKIYVIRDGYIDSSGTHQELLAMNGLYSKMWNAHISAKDCDCEEK